jgi:hypothetical protein
VPRVAALRNLLSSGASALLAVAEVDKFQQCPAAQPSPPQCRAGTGASVIDFAATRRSLTPGNASRYSVGPPGPELPHRHASGRLSRRVREGPSLKNSRRLGRRSLGFCFPTVPAPSTTLPSLRGAPPSWPALALLLLYVEGGHARERHDAAAIGADVHSGSPGAERWSVREGRRIGASAQSSLRRAGCQSRAQLAVPS